MEEIKIGKEILFQEQKRYEACNFSKYFFLRYISVLSEQHLNLEMQNLAYIKPEHCIANDRNIFCFGFLVGFGWGFFGFG